MREHPKKRLEIEFQPEASTGYRRELPKESSKYGIVGWSICAHQRLSNPWGPPFNICTKKEKLFEQDILVAK
jgi:hypothetical protein